MSTRLTTNCKQCNKPMKPKPIEMITYANRQIMVQNMCNECVTLKIAEGKVKNKELKNKMVEAEKMARERMKKEQLEGKPDTISYKSDETLYIY